MPEAGASTRLQLFRPEGPARSFLSSLGSVRETRLTAALGFLMARFPADFLPLFGLRPDGQVVSIEETDAGDRFDLLLSRGERPVIVEGKVGFDQKTDQLRRYVRKVRRLHHRRPGLVVVDQGSTAARLGQDDPYGIRREVAWVRPVEWAQVARTAFSVAQRARTRKTDPIGAAIARDLHDHLEETGMIQSIRGELYSRDVSHPLSMTEFFRHNLYTCQAKFLNSARGNLYFAPYFTANATRQLSDQIVPVREGISYVARIQDTQVLDRDEAAAYLKTLGRKDARAIGELLRNYHRRGEILVMPLGPPFLLFNPPVTKRQLPRLGAGMMGSRSWTLEKLLTGHHGAPKKARRA